MNIPIDRSDSIYTTLRLQGDDIIRRTMEFINWADVYLVSAQADVQDLPQLYWLANYIRFQCNRMVVLATELEFTHVIVAKSNDILYPHADEILMNLTEAYDGLLSGDTQIADATFYQSNIAPNLIDWAVEAIIVSMPYHE